MKKPPPPRFTRSEKLQIVHDVRTYQQRHGCSQKHAILALGHKPETVHHWLLLHARGELVPDSNDRMATALQWVDDGHPISTAAQKGGVPEAALVKALQQRPAKPRHFTFS